MHRDDAHKVAPRHAEYAALQPLRYQVVGVLVEWYPRDPLTVWLLKPGGMAVEKFRLRRGPAYCFCLGTECS